MSIANKLNKTWWLINKYLYWGNCVYCWLGILYIIQFESKLSYDTSISNDFLGSNPFGKGSHIGAREKLSLNHSPIGRSFYIQIWGLILIYRTIFWQLSQNLIFNIKIHRLGLFIHKLFLILHSDMPNLEPWDSWFW